MTLMGKPSCTNQRHAAAAVQLQRRNIGLSGVKFAWELLDIFIGQWCAMFIPHRDEREFLLAPLEGDGEIIRADGSSEDHRPSAARYTRRHCFPQGGIGTSILQAGTQGSFANEDYR